MHQIIVDTLATLLTILVYFAWMKYIKPWIVQHHLTEAAEVAVKAVEALYGRYNGEEKLDAVMVKLKNAGWDIDKENVLNAVEAAWQKMNTEQIAAGEKAGAYEPSSIVDEDNP